MPIVLDFARYLFVSTIREYLYQATDTGFRYCPSAHSYCKAPESTKLPFRDLPSIQYAATIEMCKEDQKTIRNWRDSFGNPVRQLTIRNERTKDNVGMNPLNAHYTGPDPPQKPLDHSPTNEITGTRHIEETDTQQVSGGACSFQANSVMVVKSNAIIFVDSLFEGPSF